MIVDRKLAPRILKQSHPNGWSAYLIAVNGIYVVAESPDVYDDAGDEYDTREAAEKGFADLVMELAESPNWEAQAAYDEQWGTINGYPPFNYFREH